MKTWGQTGFRPSVTCSDGRKSVEIERSETKDGIEFRVHASGPGAIRDICLRSEDSPGFSDVFVTGPNIGGVEFAHPLQTVYLGMGGEHRDTIFGRQWMYTPPPLVFPFRSGNEWFGVALSAPRGKNLFSGWTYRPSASDRTDMLLGPGGARTPSAFDLEVHFDGYCRDEGHVVSIHVLAEGKKTPLEVVKWYSQTLRDMDRAPSPARDNVTWWKEPMLCAWGEQCNQAHAKDPLHWMGDPVTMYETQNNQTVWLETLESHGVPVGLVSMSDKWQLHRERLIPDVLKYPNLRGFVDEQHAKGRKVIAWFGLWRVDDPPPSWCIRADNGEKLTADPESPGYSAQLTDGVRELISSNGYDIDGFFIDFTSDLPVRENLVRSGSLWGVELLHHYVKLIHDAAKAVKPDAMLMTHCCNPYFADVTDVLRLNDWAYKRSDVVEQARYRQGIASAVSDWLINTDNWFMYDVNEWRRYLEVQPELGIPASWFVNGVWGDGSRSYEPFTQDDYRKWASLWTEYREKQGLA